MKKLEIEPLSKSENGVLLGGFFPQKAQQLVKKQYAMETAVIHLEPLMEIADVIPAMTENIHKTRFNNNTREFKDSRVSI